MFQKLRIFIILPIVLLSLSACHKRTEGLHYIPKNALGVFSLNLKSIAKKVIWSTLADSRVLKELANSGNAKSFDINATGIDPLATIYAYGLPDQRLENKFKFLLILPLKDKDKFEQYLNETFPLAKTVKENGKTFFVIDDYSCFSWDDNTAIGAFSTPSAFNLVNGEELQVILKQDILKSFSLTKAQSLTDDKLIKDLEKEDNDFSYWFNVEAFANAMPQDEFNAAGAILSNQKNLLSNTYFTGGLNFKKGKIEVEGKYYYNPSSKALAKIFTDVVYKDDLIEKIPGQQLNLMAHLQLNPNGFAALIDSIGMMPLTKMAIKESGLQSNQIFKVLDGDFLFTIVDFDFGELTENLSETMSGKAGVPFFQSAITFNIKDKAAADSILAVAMKNKWITKKSSGIFQVGAYYMMMNGNYVVLSNEESTAIKLAKNTIRTAPWDLSKVEKNTPFSLFIDAKNTTKDFIASLPNSEEEARALKLVDYISLRGGRIDGDYSKYQFNIYMQNKEENSLLQLIHLKDNAQ